MHDRILETSTPQLQARHDELFTSFTELPHGPERREQIRKELAEVAYELLRRCHEEAFGE